jgi:hypothetical protein
VANLIVAMIDERTKAKRRRPKGLAKLSINCIVP